MLPNWNKVFHEFFSDKIDESDKFSKVVLIWNTLPKNLKTERHSYQTIKAKLKFFKEKFENEINLLEYNKKCWKDFKFH